MSIEKFNPAEFIEAELVMEKIRRKVVEINIKGREEALASQELSDELRAELEEELEALKYALETAVNNNSEVYK